MIVYPSTFFLPLPLQFVPLFLITQGQCDYNSPVACGDPLTTTSPVTLLPHSYLLLSFSSSLGAISAW